MDQTAQSQEAPPQDVPSETPVETPSVDVPQGEAPPSDGPPETPPPQFPESVNPLKKFLPFIIGGLLLLIIILGGFLLFVGGASKKSATPTPPPRPSATPILLPTATIEPTLSPIASVSATITPVEVGRLAFIKDGDIYHSDFSFVTLLAKNTSPAGGNLSWSFSGRYLSWLPKVGNLTQLTVYDREKKTFYYYPESNSAAIADYSWSPSFDSFVFLTQGATYNLDSYQVSSVSAVATSLLKRSPSISQVEWVNEKTVLFRGSDGISSVNPASPSAKLLVANSSISAMSVSPDKTKILYSVTGSQKNDLYIMGIDGTGQRVLNSKPTLVDMGTTNLPESTLDKGFLPFAIWFLNAEKLLVPYQYSANLPLVGIYDLGQNSVQIIGPNALQKDDFMVDDFRLLGVRPNPLQSGTQQLTLYTLENNAKLNVVRVIPGGSSPAFFEK
ncbi:hypothetical protein HYW55_05795 [Candidatus Gottesmanbacteria bacterium]|nr:hypothetical protein [Candidatus Gottesmanbacteria bacterium]